MTDEKVLQLSTDHKNVAFLNPICSSHSSCHWDINFLQWLVCEQVMIFCRNSVIWSNNNETLPKKQIVRERNLIEEGIPLTWIIHLSPCLSIPISGTCQWPISDQLLWLTYSIFYLHPSPPLTHVWLHLVASITHVFHFITKEGLRASSIPHAQPWRLLTFITHHLPI